ncbi:MAG TPA: dihydroorotase family protein [Candidatus Eisenbacteria bacterium]|nr:dihydroorotase family protein [Candidatus Eisenbacteria bacterium]
MTVDLVLKGGKIATSTGVIEAGIAVDQGRIVALAKETHLPKADKALNVSGLFVLPGLIDAHVHLCDPGFIRESFETGSSAAAVGGFTTVIDMASSAQLRTSTVNMFLKKRKLGEQESIVDFALYGGEISDENDLKEIGKIVEAGAVGFGEIMMAGDTPVKNDEVLLEAFSAISKEKSIAAVHAEDNSILNYYKNGLISEGRNDVNAFAEARPSLAEAEAISKTLSLSKETGVNLHICHLTTKEGSDLLRNSKALGSRVTTEVCPHHLYFTRDDYEKLGPNIITTPPLRTKEDVKELWRGVKDGNIDLLVSDHCAFTKKEKAVGWKDIWKTPPGVPGLETLAFVMLGKAVRKDWITLERFVALTSLNPAKIFGLYPKKGSLQVGADADFTVVNLKKHFKISSKDLKCVSDFTPYEGWVVKGGPVMTIVRGEVVAEEGKIVGKAGHGGFVAPLSRSIQKKD